MRYKIGDVVTVRSDLSDDECYYMDDGVTWNGVAFDMVGYAGEVVTISEYAGNGQYRIAEDDGEWYWTDEMFEDNQACAEVSDLL